LSQIAIAASLTKSHEVDEQLVVSRSDASELFELVEEALDDVALFIEVGVVEPLNLAVSFRRDDGLCADLGNPVDDMVGIIAFVGDCRGSDNAIDKLGGEGDVIALTGRADQTDRIAEGIASRVEFGAQPAPRPVQALGIRPVLRSRNAKQETRD
jgi:hypothetical protein